MNGGCMGRTANTCAFYSISACIFNPKSSLKVSVQLCPKFISTIDTRPNDVKRKAKGGGKSYSNDRHVTEAIQADSRSTLDDTTRAARECSVEIQDKASEDHCRLYLLDLEMHARLWSVTNTVNQLHLADGQQVMTMLTKEYNWMKKAQEELEDMGANGDVCNEQMQDASLQSLYEIREVVGSIMDVVGHRTKEDLNSASATIDTEPCFKRRFLNANLTILLTMLIALILNVFGHVTRPWCNAVLGLLNLLLETTLGKSTGPAIPSDIRTVRKKFDLEPITQMFATCIRCSSTYPPMATKNKSPYLECCTSTKHRGSMPCSQLLVKCTKGEG
ncbi:hypothetical protein BDR04DRAFT_1116385 [Suillus decipiens]|nr:hypothetical protein BDR04DRAFT_1116385 [Suillus decipiens]